MSEALSSILEKLSGIPELSRLGDIIEIFRDTYDVDHVYYWAMSLGLDTPPGPRIGASALTKDGGVIRPRARSVGVLSYSHDWMVRYMEQRFAEFDPLFATASGSFDPIDWRDLDYTSGQRKKIRQEADEFGVGSQGYTVPVRGPGGQFAIFTINKDCPSDQWDKLIAENRSDFLLLAHYTHQRVLQLSGFDHTHTSRQLSARERDAMRLIASGLSRAQAADKLGISENTFRVYIDSARHKLGALNVPHAIALAAHRGIVTPG